LRGWNCRTVRNRNVWSGRTELPTTRNMREEGPRILGVWMVREYYPSDS